ncbi:hypothetical protein C6T52_14410 [Burkholderia multivorans]|nr:hypothetical protein C6T52_14410 [Burkholderia multivorans]PRG38470.1 hypothetical protein C6T68_12455 [Burkholderia multivorans]PRH19290.1 hypothetical protein C6T71_23825 [Burkholderia multivorans]PTO46299.1 hypothetical protein DBB31_25050 [Burkholderia multivorans]
MDTRFQHLAHRDCHVNSPRGLGLKPAAVPAARTRPERSPAPRGRHPGCAGLRFGTCELRVPQAFHRDTDPRRSGNPAFGCRLSQRV